MLKKYPTLKIMVAGDMNSTLVEDSAKRPYISWNNVGEHCTMGYCFHKLAVGPGHIRAQHLLHDTTCPLHWAEQPNCAITITGSPSPNQCLKGESLLIQLR